MPQRIKRLFLIIIISVIVILLAKSLLGKALKNLSIETQIKQKANASKQLSLMPPSAAIQHSGVPVSIEVADTLAQSAPAVSVNQ